MPDLTCLPFTRSAILAAALAATASLAVPASDAVAQAAQEALPSREALELSSALSRLSRDPRNVEALTDAGIAASKLGDFEAAVGFFKRGQALAPTNPRLLAGLAGALVRQGDAAAAIPLFAQAQSAGAPAATIAADRGLAYDLIGDPLTAQRYYSLAAATGADRDEVTRRLAISQAIAGDGDSMEKTLLPLLKKQDKPAWRARAFGLAILGQGKEAGRIVKTLLPGTLADGITPYLQYMPRLTRAQQAAAANLGVFPRASEIGRDDTRLAALTQSAPGRNAGAGLVPAGKPLGAAAAPASASSSRSTRQQAREDDAKTRREAKLALDDKRRQERLAQASRNERRVAPPEPKPGREDTEQNETGFTVAREAPVPKVAEIMNGRSQPAPAPQPAPRAVPQPAAPQPAPAEAARASQAVAADAAPSTALGQVALAQAAPPTPAAASQQPAAASPSPAVAATPGFDLARLPAASEGAPAPAPATASSSASVTNSAPAPSFGALFADLGKPTTVISPAEGSVDIRKIEPKRPAPKPKQEAKPAPEPKKQAPTQPSRIWVQLGIGQRVAALNHDWRRMQKANPAVFKGQKAYSARLNQTNRLLTGPFASTREANAFIESLRKAGVSGPYIWTSPTGEVVDELGK